MGPSQLEARSSKLKLQAYSLADSDQRRQSRSVHIPGIHVGNWGNAKRHANKYHQCESTRHAATRGNTRKHAHSVGSQRVLTKRCADCRSSNSSYERDSDKQIKWPCSVLSCGSLPQPEIQIRRKNDTELKQVGRTPRTPICPVSFELRRRDCRGPLLREVPLLCESDRGRAGLFAPWAVGETSRRSLPPEILKRKAARPR